MKMNNYEEYLKNHICSNCKISLLDPHPDEKMNYQGWVKCKSCGFCKEINERKRKSDIIKKD